MINSKESNNYEWALDLLMLVFMGLTIMAAVIFLTGCRSTSGTTQTTVSVIVSLVINCVRF